MPLNLLKTYNDLLDFGAYNAHQRRQSLQAVFDQDITNNPIFTFKTKPIQPTSKDGEISMETLFIHLTTVITDKSTRKREYDYHRAVRLHWVKYHIDENKQDDMLHFSVREPKGIRTYIYDKVEKYVIILEPLRKMDKYYLLTAYHLTGRDAKRNKIVEKYNKRRLNKLH